MAHGYRKIQQWDQWLTHHVSGINLLTAETHLLAQVLARHFGKQALVIGSPQQISIVNHTKVPCHSLITPLFTKASQPGIIQGDFYELPILTGSIDLVVVPHTLEFIDNPLKLLTESCRVVRPEGLIVVFGFNPFSSWGVHKLFAKKNHAPWNANTLLARQVKKWLQYADFQMEQQHSILFRPLLENAQTFQRLQFLEKLGNTFFPYLGSVYILIARAKVIPLTPIKLKWKQQLSNIRIPSTITGHIAR